MTAQQIITQHLDIWTAAKKNRSTAGRGSNNKLNLYGIKKLRELILELAVRGKLVPQDPNDEPAATLIEKIVAEKAKLIKEGTIKREKLLPEITEDEKPFELPNGWAWTRWNDIAQKIGDIDHKMPSEYDKGIPYVSPRDFFPNNKIDFTNAKKISLEDFEQLAKKIQPQRGDIIFPRYGTIGENILVETDQRFLASYSCCVIKTLVKFISPKYQFIYSISGVVVEQCRKAENKTTQANVGIKSIQEFIIPIPPFAEQHRIAAKVDELMTFCDQLEQTQSDNIAAHAQLVEALLATLITTDGVYAGNAGAISGEPNSSDHNELQNNWQRIAAHFDTLFTTEHSIDQLKQTILQLAVMGKLVPQNPNDEPASELLKKIATEKAQLIKEGKIKKEKPLPEITDEEKPFELPGGWEWVKFGYIAEFINGDRGKNYPNVSEYVDQGVAWINTGHIEPNGTLTSSDMNFITREKFDSLRGGKIQEGDLVYCLRGATFGKTAFVTPYSEGAIASSLMIIRPYRQELNLFIYRYLISSTGRSQIFRFDNGSAQPNLSAGNVMLYVFPLPPIAEQHRIVAKVDELMALCDTLKTNLQNAQTTQLALADALVEQAVN